MSNSMDILLLGILVFHIATCTELKGLKFTQMPTADEVYSGPVALSFLTPSSIIMSERTSVSIIDFKANTKTMIIGSADIGGYVDGPALKARFSLINDLAVQGNYIYIADYSCVRVYDMQRKLIATLAGTCGRIEETVSTTIVPPTFNGHLKLIASSREIYVLDTDRILKVDKETGATWLLSVGQLLSEGYATSIELDKFSSQLFVAVATPTQINVVTVDTLNGKQTLYGTIKNQKATEDREMTVMLASLSVAEDDIYVLEPTALHKISRLKLDVTSLPLASYGYHEIAMSSEYLVLSQEFYSRMYKLNIVNLTASKQSLPELQVTAKISIEKSAAANSGIVSLNIFESQMFYLAVVLPCLLFLLVIVVMLCTTKRILRSQMKRHQPRPDSDNFSEKYFLHHDKTQWV